MWRRWCRDALPCKLILLFVVYFVDLEFQSWYLYLRRRHRLVHLEAPYGFTAHHLRVITRRRVGWFRVIIFGIIVARKVFVYFFAMYPSTIVGVVLEVPPSIEVGVPTSKVSYIKLVAEAGKGSWEQAVNSAILEFNLLRLLSCSLYQVSLSKFVSLIWLMYCR